MKLQIAPGSTDVSRDIFVQDSSSTTGDGRTGLAYNTSGLAAFYHRPGSAAVEIPLVTQTVTGSHTDGGFAQIDADYMPGIYRLDIPDAALAAGVRFVTFILHGAANMAPVLIEIDLAAEVDTNRATALVDGVPILTCLAAMMAVLLNVAEPSSSGVNFRNRADSADLVEVLLGTTRGERTSSTINEEAVA